MAASGEPSPGELESKVSQLKEMGFRDKQARIALKTTGGNIGRAIRWLSGVPESELTSALPAGSTSFHSQMNFGPSMTFHTVNCNNVMIGHNQKMTVVENHVHHHAGPGWPPGRRATAQAAFGRREAPKQPTAATTGRIERDSANASSSKKSCFVSYYAETAEERDQVLQLSSELRKCGIDCEVDIYHEDNPPGNWATWVEAEITSRNVTLIVCSRAYYEVLHEKRRVHEYARVHFEGQLMYSLIYSASPNRFIPVFLGANNPIKVEYIPAVLRASHKYHISQFPLELGKAGHEQFTSLYAFLSGQDRKAAPGVRDVASLP